MPGGGFIKGILRWVRCTKSLRVLFLHRRPPSWTTLVLYSRAVFIFNEPALGFVLLLSLPAALLIFGCTNRKVWPRPRNSKCLSVTFQANSSTLMCQMFQVGTVSVSIPPPPLADHSPIPDPRQALTISCSLLSAVHVDRLPSGYKSHATEFKR